MTASQDENNEASRQSNGNVISTRALYNKKVWYSKPKKKNPDAVKKLGRIHSWVFYPNGARCAGFLVKRPDIALMFHRQDSFVAFNGFEIFDGDIVIKDDTAASGKGACKALQVNLDDCVIWSGLPVMCKDGTTFGLVGNVDYDKRTGKVIDIAADKGATANTLLGQLVIPAEKIIGFKRGIGTQLYVSDEDNDPNSLGALLVDESVKELVAEGGVAEKAGAATAVATDKAKKAVKKVKPGAKKAVESAQEITGKATDAVGNAAEKGAFATGRQVMRAKGMFGRFAEEFKAAYNGEDSDGDSAK